MLAHENLEQTNLLLARVGEKRPELLHKRGIP